MSCCVRKQNFAYMVLGTAVVEEIGGNDADETHCLATTRT